ncbi:MAG: argininosuccinate lyase, partial [Gammaproteobacteria bacterium]
MSDKSKTEKPWGGRFNAPTNEFVESFTASVQFDKRLYRHDIIGSIAHATMLCETGIIGAAECERIVEGLNEIRADIEAGRFQWSV